MKDYCDAKKILFFSTPFDKEAVWFLDDIKVKLFKLASFDISNYQLISEVAKTKKPTIVSTGMANLNEIKKIHKFFKNKKSRASYTSLYFFLSKQRRKFLFIKYQLS